MKRNSVYVAIMIVLLLIIGLLSFQLLRNKDQQTVATVGNTKISHADWIAALKSQYGSDVLEGMINHEVVLQTAASLGIKVTERQITQELNRIKMGYTSDEEFAAALGVPLEELKKDLEFNLLLEDIAIKDVYISDPEVEEYYQQNLDLFTEPAQLYLYQIIVETEETAEQVIDELRNGATFETLAQEMSFDRLSSGNGGEIGWVTYDDPTLEESVLNVAFNSEVNVVSEPIAVPEGYAIIKVTDKKEENVREYSEIKEEIRREIALSQVDSLPEVLEQLRDDIGVEK